MQEESTKVRRWLLPFTHNVDLTAIGTALRLANEVDATLVAVSLIATPCASQMRGVRLELIQQSKDFLEAVRYKALRLNIPLEVYEEYAPDVLARLACLARELESDGIVLASRGKEPLLLSQQEMQQLFLSSPAPLMLVRLPERRYEKVLHWSGFKLSAWWESLHKGARGAFDEGFPRDVWETGTNTPGTVG